MRVPLCVRGEVAERGEVVERLCLGRSWRVHHLRSQLLTAESKDWSGRFVNQSPALDNSMKNRATKNTPVTNLGDRRKTQVCGRGRPHPTLSFLLFILAFVVTSSGLLVFVQLPASSSSSSVHLPSHWPTLRCHLNSPVVTDNVSDEEALRRAIT